MAEKFTLPTEMIELPSQGKIYDITNPLSSGTIEMKYMTAREEDILTNINLLRQGIAIEKMLQSIIKSPIKYEDLSLGDRNSLLIASRILAYGSAYSFEYYDSESETKETISIDLNDLKNKEVDKSIKYAQKLSTIVVQKKGINIVGEAMDSIAIPLIEAILRFVREDSRNSLTVSGKSEIEIRSGSDFNGNSKTVSGRSLTIACEVRAAGSSDGNIWRTNS